MTALLLCLVNQRGADDACWNGNDGVAENHDGAGEEAAKDGGRGDVAIANGGEGDDCPVDAGWNVGELSVWFITFDHVHEGAEYNHEDDHKEEIDSYLSHALLDALQEEIAFVDEGEEAKHTEDSNESEGSENEEIASACQEWYEREVERQGCQEVNNAKEAERILLWLWRAVYAQEILESEDECEFILDDEKRVLEH